ncbi:MAG: hypothetical protein FWC98_00980 [Bacteroidales bacterium]|nr:hypothetical protein [Bacteroidales bacterium]
MKRIFTLAFCLTSMFVQAQQTDTRDKRVFFYDTFQRGTAFFLDGTFSVAMLNYNFVSGEIQFINHLDGSILNLVRDPGLSHIEIQNEIFVPVDRGFAVMILDGPVALLQKDRITLRRRTTGALGIETNTATGQEDVSLVSIVSLPTAREFETSTERNPHLINHRIETTFFLMKDQKVYSATRRNFLRLYREVRPQLETFIRENNVDFRNEQHLRGLTMFANSLLMAR